MIDIKLIRTNLEEVKKGIAKKGYDPGLADEVFGLDEKYRRLLKKEEELRHLRKGKTGESEREEALKTKGEIKQITSEKDLLSRKLEELIVKLPNLPLPEAPNGKEEKDNVELKRWGTPRQFEFETKDHVDIGKNLGILNFEDGAKLSGSQFYFLDGAGALLELGLIQFGVNLLTKEGFVPSFTPDLAKSRYYLGTGYLPKGNEAQTYEIQDEDLGLVATAEIALAGRHADQIIKEEELPLEYAGLSHCFRRESGSYGKYSKGLYRVHQFTKLEMFVYCLPEDSPLVHERLLGIEEKIWQALGIPYRVIEMCAGELGAIAARKFDIEAWMPGRGEYGEVTSASNCTDYQARNLNIRIKRRNGEITYAHMLNGTAIAVSRAIVAILENYQNADGSVTIPEALRPFMQGMETIA